MAIQLPTTEAPRGFCWAYRGQDAWEIQPDETYGKTCYQVTRPNGEWIVGYYDRELAERFLTYYAGQYPGETLVIAETVDT